MSVLFNAFSIFMIGISCIGLFGLSAIAIENRKKEIGIRKVVGASVPSILRILSKEFILLVLVGAGLALPLAWYAMNAWLEKFAFKISITGDVFIISFLVAITVALSAVLINTLKAAIGNPVDSLRSE
jgi:putative ABC transport system permease protein